MGNGNNAISEIGCHGERLFCTGFLSREDLKIALQGFVKNTRRLMHTELTAIQNPASLKSGILCTVNNTTEAGEDELCHKATELLPEWKLTSLRLTFPKSEN